MKAKLYPCVRVIGFLSVLLFFQKNGVAQCDCGPGEPATPVTQIITITPTTTSVLNFDFQQFNPSIGTLSCVTLHDTITGTSVTGARNTGPDTTAFLFFLSLTNKILGPGINITHNFNRTYGYDTLTPFNTPGDSITYGPENIITNPYGTGSTGGNAAYLGIGTVRFSYTINGGMITVDGGANYNSSVSTTIGGTLALTYYWCPAVVLAIKNKLSPFKPGTAPGNETMTGTPMTIYPNPAGRQFSLQFNKAMTGDFEVDIVSLTGQKVFTRNIRLNNARSAQMELNTQQPPGIYYLRAIDRKSGTAYVNKLFIKS